MEAYLAMLRGLLIGEPPKDIEIILNGGFPLVPGLHFPVRLEIEYLAWFLKSTNNIDDIAQALLKLDCHPLDTRRLDHYADWAATFTIGESGTNRFGLGEYAVICFVDVGECDAVAALPRIMFYAAFLTQIIALSVKAKPGSVHIMASDAYIAAGTMPIAEAVLAYPTRQLPRLVIDEGIYSFRPHNAQLWGYPTNENRQNRVVFG